jgi:integrase
MSRRSGQSGQVVERGLQWIGRYYVDVPGQDKRVRKSIPIGYTKTMGKFEARRKLKDLIEEQGINKPAHLERSVNSIKTFSQQADWFLENVLPLHKRSSQNSSKYNLKRHLVPHFKDMYVDEIKSQQVQEWLTLMGRKISEQKKKRLAPKTIQNVYKVLRLVLPEQSKTWSVKLPSLIQKEQRYFTPEEAQRIVDAAEGQYKVLFALHFAAGMRISELTGLRVEDVNFKESIIHIGRSMFIQEEDTPKTAAGHRNVDIDSATLDMLKEFIGKRKDGRLFLSKRGTALVGNNINREVLKPTCRKLGIPEGTTHAFRHGRISVLVQNGVPGELIKKWVGHTDLRTTARYSHFPSEYRKEVVSKLAIKS